MWLQAWVCAQHFAQSYLGAEGWGRSWLPIRCRRPARTDRIKLSRAALAPCLPSPAASPIYAVLHLILCGWFCSSGRKQQLRLDEASQASDLNIERLFSWSERTRARWPFREGVSLWYKEQVHQRKSFSPLVFSGRLRFMENNFVLHPDVNWLGMFLFCLSVCF